MKKHYISAEIADALAEQLRQCRSVVEDVDHAIDNALDAYDAEVPKEFDDGIPAGVNWYERIRSNPGSVFNVPIEHYDDAIGAVPPIYHRHVGSGFNIVAMGEAYDHDAETGKPIFYCYTGWNGCKYGVLSTLEDATDKFEEHFTSLRKPAGDARGVLSDAERDVIEALRSRGFVLAVWTPSEVGNAPPRRCEDRITELGNEAIGWLQGEDN